MSELHEDLQILKEGQIASQASNVAARHGQPDIKVRLNLHVKRRLQQEPKATISSNAESLSPLADDGCMESQNKMMKLSKTKGGQVAQHPPKPNEKVVGRQALLNAGIRKSTKKQKLKSAKNSKAGAAVCDDTNDGEANCTEEEDEEQPSGPPKEKSSDVLDMVLGLKKRALLQQPEVQEFLTKVMKAIKDE